MLEEIADRKLVLGVAVHSLRRVEAVGQVIALAARKDRSLVVTANLDHVVRIRRDPEFRRIYEGAQLVLADGFPLVAASRFRGPRLPERVTGADLIEPVCGEASRRGQSIFILGTRLQILSKACRILRRQFPALEIAGVHSPSFGFSTDHPESHEIADMIRASQPSIVFVALGSPKQERWVAAYMDQLPPAVYLCVGAGFDYLARCPRRAPAALRRSGFEWLWRLLLDPRGHAKRCAVDAIYLPILLVEHFRRYSPRKRSSSSPIECQPKEAPTVRHNARLG